MNKKKYKLSLLVLLYNKEFSDSLTLKTLMAANVFFENCKLVIWNNGPKNIKLDNVESFKDKGFDVTVETVGNESLGIIYNEFISMFSSQKYMMLDDDSELNDIYLSEAIQASSDYLSVPIISMNGQVEGPIVDNSLYNPEVGLNSAKKIMAIGSGLIIGSGFSNIVKNKYGNIFDERFYLYGVDSSFFHRINKMRLINKVTVINVLNHSLSRLENESEELREFRKLERTYDLALSIKYYFNSPLKLFYNVVKINALSLSQKLLGLELTWNIKQFNSALLSGKHYRHGEKKQKVFYNL